MLNTIKQYIKTHFPFFKATPYIIMGKWLHTGELGKILFVGKEVDLNYFQSLFFEQVTTQSLGKKYFWQ